MNRNDSSDTGWKYQKFNKTYTPSLERFAFCYSQEGQLVVAEGVGTDPGTSNIYIFEPHRQADGTWSYSQEPDQTIPAAQFQAERIACHGDKLYFISNRYGTRDGNNEVYISDRKTEKVVVCQLPQFDITTALAYGNGKLYVAGEKKGVSETITVTYNSFLEDGRTNLKYNSTYAVYSYNLKDDGSPDPDSAELYLSYTDEDVMNVLKETYPADYDLLVHSGEVEQYKHYFTYVYGTISDLAVSEGTVYAIRNLLAVHLKYYQQDGSSGTDGPKLGEKNSYGDILTGENGNAVQVCGLQNRFVPGRFIAVKPKEFDMTCIEPKPSYLMGMEGEELWNLPEVYLMHLNVQTREFTALDNPSGKSYYFDSVRNGSNFISSLHDLNKAGHIFAVQE